MASCAGCYGSASQFGVPGWPLHTAHLPRHGLLCRTTLQVVGVGLAGTAVSLALLINSQLDADGAYGRRLVLPLVVSLLVKHVMLFGLTDHLMGSHFRSVRS